MITTNTFLCPDKKQVCFRKDIRKVPHGRTQTRGVIMDKELSPNIDGGSVFERNTLNTNFLYPVPRSTVLSSIHSDNSSFALHSLSTSDNPKGSMDLSVSSAINIGFIENSEQPQNMDITTNSRNDNTRNESNGHASEIKESLDATNTEDDLHFLLFSEAQFISNKLARRDIFEDSFDGNLDSIQPPWVEDPELNCFLDMDTELEISSQTENKVKLKQVKAVIEESHSQIIQECETETRISPEETKKPEELDNSPLKLLKSASCDDLIKSMYAKEIVTELQKILSNPFKSNDKKVSQGQQLVRSLSDLLLVTTDGEHSEASSKAPVQNQRSKSFTGLKKSYAIPEKAVNLSMATKVPNIKLPNADFAGKLKIKKNEHEPRKGPLKAMPLANLKHTKKTPENSAEVVKTHTPENGPALKPCASSTPILAGTVRKTQKSPTPKRKSYSDGPKDLQKVKLSPSNQFQKKKEDPATSTVSQAGTSWGGRGIRSSMGKIRENMGKLPEYKDFNKKGKSE